MIDIDTDQFCRNMMCRLHSNGLVYSASFRVHHNLGASLIQDFFLEYESLLGLPWEHGLWSIHSFSSRDHMLVLICFMQQEIYGEFLLKYGEVFDYALV